MTLFNPLKFQQEAIETLTSKFVKIWKKDGRQLPIVFKAPTGSGKTFMMAHFIRGLNHLPNWDEDKSFIWITFSDNLAMQSKKKFQEYFENTLENNLLTVSDINRGKLNKNEILFLNWQKVVSKSEETKRILRRPEDENLRKEKGLYFEDFIENTQKAKREIILIIDEAHTHVTKEGAQPIIDKINPKVILHVSATPDPPIIAQAAEFDSFVKIEHSEAVDAGLIKERILVQTEEDIKKYKGKDTDEILLNLGLDKRKELADEFKKLGKSINPLVLIQLPNDDNELIERGEKTKEDVVMNYLLSKGVKEGKIAKWFDDHPRPEFLEENDDEHEFLLFKQAAGTGWDCPRAHVLIMFREITSDTFYIQTVGRILRMSEPHNKEDYINSPNIRTGYLYTNYERKQVASEWDEISPNKLPTLVARRKKEKENIKLQSDYVSRAEYGDLSSSAKFQESFKKSMNKYFGITENDTLKGVASKKLANKGVDLKPHLTNQFIVNAKFEEFDHMGYEFKTQGKDIQLEISRNDVEKTFNYICMNVLKEQTEEDAKIGNIARSWSPLKSSLRVWFKSVLADDSNYFYRVFINDLNKRASSVFRPAITQAIKDYKPILQKIIAARRKVQEERGTHTFTIQDEYWFTDDYEAVTENKLCVLDKAYFLKDYKGKINEARFREYIDSKKEKINWWFKNADYGKEYYSIKYYDTSEKAFRLFYPDWIIKLKDGRIGIFETKAGETATGQNVKDKAKALHQRIKSLGKKFVGGIVILENGVWQYNDSENYDYVPGKKLSKNWKKLEESLK